MQLSDVIQSHIAQSLEEMRDPAKFRRWEDGTRAEEEAQKIVAAVLAERIKSLEAKK